MRIRPWENQMAVDEVHGWYHYCWLKLEAGEELKFDPFYPRNNVLTPEIVRAVLLKHDENIDFEIRNYPVYHSWMQGFTAVGQLDGNDLAQRQMARDNLRPNNWSQLPYPQQLAIVQGVDKILNSHRMTEEDETKEREDRLERITKYEELARRKAANIAEDPQYYACTYMGNVACPGPPRCNWGQTWRLCEEGE